SYLVPRLRTPQQSYGPTSVAVFVDRQTGNKKGRKFEPCDRFHTGEDDTRATNAPLKYQKSTRMSSAFFGAVAVPGAGAGQPLGRAPGAARGRGDPTRRPNLRDRRPRRAWRRR